MNRAKLKERQEVRRRQLPTHADPAEASALLHDPALLLWAANPWLNSHWHHARMTTRGRDGLTVLDAFGEVGAEREWIAKASALLKLELDSMRDQIPPLKLTPISKKPEWDPEYEQKETRDIVVPCILRRVLSAHLAHILTITTKGRLSRAARAYVDGSPDPAPRMAKEVAKLTQKGHFFYVKFDIKDAFNSIGWKPLRQALLGMGYPQRFVDIVMVLVQAPVEKRVRGQWLRQPRSRGALAGLPESGILLNILMREIDERILRECDVHYPRFSDDLVISGTTVGDVAKAAKLFVNWAWSVGLEVKGVPRRTDPTRLVKDIREDRLELLGIELDHQGDSHMPQGKVDGQQSKLSHFVQQAIRSPRLIVGRSKYASEAPQRGIETADQDDLDEMIWGFFKYWHPLNQAEAELFRSSASARVSFGTLRQGYGPHRKLFVAVLGRESAHSPLRAGDESGLPHLCPSDWIAREVLPLVEDCLAFEPGAPEAARRPTGVPALGRDEDSRARERLASPSPGLGTSGVGGQSLDIESYEVGLIDSWESSHGVESPSHQSVSFDRGASDGLDEVDASDSAPATPWDRPARDTGWSQGDIANAIFCFADARTIDAETVAVGIQEFVQDNLEMRPRRPLVRISRNVERAVAHLQVLTERRRAAAILGRPFVALGPGWLPKQLIVGRASFRRLGIFKLVMTFHEQAARDGQPVLVLGPVRATEQLMAAMTHVVERPAASTRARID